LQKHCTSKDTNVFYSESKTNLKLRCSCIWNSSYSRVPKTFLVDWRLYVAYYYSTTPVDYPSITRGKSMSPPVAVNIDICGYLQFLSITFVWIIGAQYATDNLSGHESFFPFIGQCWYFNAQWTPQRRLFTASCVRTVLVSWENAQLLSDYIYVSVLVEGFRRWRGYNLAPGWKPDLHGTCSLASHSI
jgi:hypothetical protein